MFFYSCAQIVNPSGGPKDTKPPRAVKYIPDSAARNFSSKNIAIVFDEYIQLADLQKQLIISPPLKNQPDIKVKGRTLFIELKDTLKKNTTYTFNFGNSIRDYTEGNAKEDFQYIFSTGDFIDSLKLSGNVKNAFDNKPEKGIVVMLYETLATPTSVVLSNDSFPYKKLPSYFAKTKDDGSYKINNIKAGTYKAFVLKDINSNFLYDSPEELIGFSDTLIKISKKTSLNFILFQEIPAKQKLKKAIMAEHGHLIFSFIKPTSDSLKLNFLSKEPKENVIYEFSKERDTLHYWFADDLQDTMKIILTEGKKFRDTVRLRPIALEQAKTSKRGEKWQLKVKTNVNKDKLFDINKNISVSFNHPVGDNWHTEKIIFTTSTGKQPQCVDTTKEISKILFFHNWDLTCHLYNDSSYKLFVPPSTFTDIFGLTNDTIKIDFKTQEEKFCGTLKLNLKIPKIKSQYILQLLDEKENIVKEDFISGAQTLNYTFLSPGSYKLKIIYDKNSDGKWTTGNYLQKRQPEKIIYYSKPITIRSNWDLELEWKVE